MGNTVEFEFNINLTNMPADERRQLWHSLKQNYPDFARFLRDDFVLGVKARYGATITAISLQKEPTFKNLS